MSYVSSGPVKLNREQELAAQRARPPQKKPKTGTAIRNSNGVLQRGELNGLGQPMGVPGGPGRPMTYQHDFSSFDRAFGGARPGPVAPAPSSSTPAPEFRYDSEEPEYQSPAATPPQGFPTRTGDGGYGQVTEERGSSGAVHQVQSIRPIAPGWDSMTPEQRAYTLMRMPHSNSGGVTTGQEPGEPFDTNPAPVVGGTTFSNQYGIGSVRDAATTQPGAAPGSPFHSRIPGNDDQSGEYQEDRAGVPAQDDATPDSNPNQPNAASPGLPTITPEGNYVPAGIPPFISPKVPVVTPGDMQDIDRKNSQDAASSALWDKAISERDGRTSVAASPQSTPAFNPTALPQTSATGVPRGFPAPSSSGPSAGSDSVSGPQASTGSGSFPSQMFARAVSPNAKATPMPDDDEEEVA